MKGNTFNLPHGFFLERLLRRHPRKSFRSGEPKVDDWLATKALQNQDKRLSVTKVLLDPAGEIAGFYTLAPGQVNFGDLPVEVMKHLPHRLLPVAVLAWLGVTKDQQGMGLGRLLLLHSLLDCYEGAKTFPFVAVVLDCVSSAAKLFFERWDFRELPGKPFRLFLSADRLEALLQEP